jgi:hypothetical protein
MHLTTLGIQRHNLNVLSCPPHSLMNRELVQVGR